MVTANEPLRRTRQKIAALLGFPLCPGSG